MTMQINNMLAYLSIFEDAMVMAARKDDGKMSREEQKQISQIRRASNQFRKTLLNMKE
jgi:malic enzyme